MNNKFLFAILISLVFLNTNGNGQNCDQIKMKIVAAIDKDKLDEALNQIKAFRACDVNGEGKKLADDWTDQIFRRVKELEQQLRKAQGTLKLAAQDARQKKIIAEGELAILDKEKRQALLFQQKATEEDEKAQQAILEKKKAQALNLLLVEVNEQHLLGIKNLSEKKYAEAIHIFRLAIDKINKTDSTYEGMIDKLDLINKDLNRAQTEQSKRQKFASIIIQADSLSRNGDTNFVEVIKLYELAKSMRVDSALVLAKLRGVESRLSKRFLNWPLYDSSLIARAHLYSNLLNYKKMKSNLDKFINLEPQSLPDSKNLLVSSYLSIKKTKIFEGLELGLGVKTFYYDPFKGQNKIKVLYQGNFASFTHSYRVTSPFLNLTYTLNNNNSFSLVFVYSKEDERSKANSVAKNGIYYLNLYKPRVHSMLSVLYNKNILNIYNKKQSRSFSLKLSGGLTYGGYILPMGEFELSFLNQPTSLKEVVPFPTSLGLPEQYHYKSPNWFFANNFSLKKFRFSPASTYIDGYDFPGYDFPPGIDFVNVVLGTRLDFRPSRRLPIYSFLTFDYSYTLGNKSKPITIYPGEEIYQDFLFHYRDRITESFRQEVYNYYQSCDCEITYERNPRRYTTGFSIALGLSYRF